MRRMRNLSSSRIGRRPAISWRSRPPTPIGPPPLPMPANHRFGLHDEQRLAPAPEPATNQDPEPSIDVRQPWPRVPTLKDEEQLAKAKVLRDQGGSRPKETCDRSRHPSNHLSVPP